MSRSRRWPTRSGLVAAIAWLLYGAYEYALRLEALCPGECNIRVDLLLIYPLLAMLTLVAAWFTLRRAKQH